MAADLPEQPQAVLASDMLNLPVFLTSLGHLAPPEHALDVQRLPVALYFHENQLSYPLQAGEKRDLDYALINVTSALRAQRLLFNSAFHLASFFDELPRLLKHFPEYNEMWLVKALRAKARVLPLGLDLARLDAGGPAESRSGRALVLWNHRWEYDKAPAEFFRAAYALADEGLDFGLVLLGESSRNLPAEFLEARERLGERVVRFGYAEDASDYARWLWRSDIVVSTALHEFFGAAVVEACYCGCFPVLPRRLSYPELIPGERHQACLYGDFDGLLDRLRSAIVRVDETRRQSLRAHMAQYDWSSVALRYDEVLGDLVTPSD
jgi:glycosyltransferase involved in cell wall biosynthesis